MDILENLGNLIAGNVDFKGNTELEGLVENLVNKAAAVKGAGIEFKNLAGENQQTIDAGNSLVDLAGEIGKSFPHLTGEQGDKFKGIVGKVYDNPDPAVDASAQAIFDAAVDTVVAAQQLSDYVVENATDEDDDDDTNTGGGEDNTGTENRPRK